MDLTRVRRGDLIAAASGVLLFVFMFLDWFEPHVSGGSAPVAGGGNAWETLDVIPIVVVIAVVAALGQPLLRTSGKRENLPIPGSVIVAALGIVAALLVLYRIIDPPGAGESAGLEIDVTRKIGAYLGFFAAAGIAVGGYLAMQEEGTSFAAAADSLAERSRGARPGGA
jgi:hypothetical protein